MTTLVWNWLGERDAEIERLLKERDWAWGMGYDLAKAETIEKCARRLEVIANISSNSMRQDDFREAAAALRALKDEP